jgi:arylsulfatase A-like enzyme
MGKRGYPAAPEVFDVPILIRHPEGRGAGERSDLLVQHTDITAAILEAAGVKAPVPIHGLSFLDNALKGGPPLRDHVTVAFSASVTVVNGKWWFNSKLNGKGPFLYDLESADPFDTNMADANPEIVRQLFAVAVDDAGGEIPDWVTRLADQAEDAPGCSALAARE